MKPIQIISQDVFDKIRSRFENLEMGDETGAVTIDPAAARFFDFDFVIEGNNLGRVSISINDLGSLKIYYSKGITENQDSMAKKLWYSFLKEMRMFAKRRLLTFDTRDITKTNLDKKDFQYLANKNAEESDMNQMNESRWNNKSSKKTSRAVSGTTEVIVRHNKTVDQTYPGARSNRRNIKAIFIQNRDGERFKYPFIHPAGAFAMAQHVDHGGVPHDPAGKAIIQMSEEISKLQLFNKQVQSSQLHDDAVKIIDTAHSRLMELRSLIEALGKKRNYESWIKEFNEEQLVDETDLDDVTLEDYKSKFTQTNFKEELTQFFPLLHRIMSERNSINLEDYVEENSQQQSNEEILGALSGGVIGALAGGPLSALVGAAAGDSLTDPDEDEVEQEGFAKFEQWAEAVEQGKLDPDQIKDLKTSLNNLQVPLKLETAYNFFNEFGINDTDLENAFDQEQSRPQELQADALSVFTSWANQNYPELLLALGISSEKEPVSQEPVTSDPSVELEMEPTVENTDMQMPLGTMEDKNKSIISKVASICKQHYNADNPHSGPWPKGEEGILIELEKQITDEFGEEAAHKARQLAEKFMEKLTQQWQQRHENSDAMTGKSIDRLKELANLIKTKMEGIGDRGHGGKDFNVNIMPMSESKTLPEGWKGSTIGSEIGGTLGAAGGLPGTIVGKLAGAYAGDKIGDMLDSENEEQVNEIAPLIAAGARALLPVIQQVGPKIGQMFTQAGKTAGQAVGQVAKQGAEITAKNAVPIGLGAGAYQAITDLAKEIPGGVGQVYKDATSAASEIAKVVGGVVDSNTIKQLADMAVKYALPIGAVIAILYGGKKIIDKIFAESYDEELEEMARIRQLSGLTK